MGIIKDFQQHYTAEKEFSEFKDFQELVLQINRKQPDQLFTEAYLEKVRSFLKTVIELRNEQLKKSEDKMVIENFYKA
jgi:sulfite reductase (ferredoxin)